MRPVRLTFAGLRSYRAEAVIDFADLDLFAIVGDTGAGKSTIIEALSLALYGKKTWTRGGSAKSDLIADGETVMRIELTFEADGQQWTVTRSWRRSGPGINKLERVDKVDKVDGSVEVTKRITELLGLDHAQFTQAVVMPQGRFDELLQASASDRSRLLASILGLDAVRRTGTEAGALRARWLEPLALATDRRAHLPLDPAADLAEAERAEAELAVRATALGTAVAVVEAHDARALALGRSLDAVGRALAAVPALETDPVAELAAAQQLGEELVERHQQLGAEAKALDAVVERLDDTSIKVLDGFGGRDEAFAARTRLRSAGDVLAGARAELATADDALAALAASAPVITVDPALDAAVADAEARAAAATAARAEAASADEAARRAWTTLAELRIVLATRSAAAATATEGLERAARVAADAAEARDRADVVAQDASAQLVAAQRADAAAAIASGCEGGDDCPVCRRPLPADFEAPPGADLDAAARQATEASAALDRARELAVGTERDHAHARDAAARTVEDERSAAEAVDAAVIALHGAGGDPDAPDVGAATAATRDALDVAERLAREAAEAHRDALEARSTAMHGLEVARVAHEAQVGAAQRERTAAERRVADQAAISAELPPAWRPGDPRSVEAVHDAGAAIDAMLVELDAIETERRATRDARAVLDQQLAEVASRAEHEVTSAAREALGVVNARLARIADLADVLGTARSLVVDDVEPVLDVAEEGADPDPATVAPTLVDASTSDDTDTTTDADAALAPPALLPATAKARELGPLVAVAAGALAQAEAIEARGEAVAAQLADQQVAAATAVADALGETGCASVGELRSEHGRTTERLAQAGAAVGLARTQLANAAGLDRFLEVAGPFVANLTVLAEALRDRQFVDHLVTAREAELIAEADRRLRAISGARFGFVRDFGIVSVASGEVRTPDALSGGERFQAALALALSLVEIASRGRGKLEAVFVDEGFGSLDSRSLDAALATLGEVAGGGKMVGLISHLKPVAEAVETVLLVTKDDVRGSTIRRLDGDAREQMLDDDIRSGLTA